MMMGRFFMVLAAVIIAFVGDLFTQAQPNDPPKDFTNSLGMKFVWIPPGDFVMGSPRQEQDRGMDEIQHNVRLTKGFYMGVFLVTQEEWGAVMGKNPSRFKDEKKLPVDSISWYDCQAFLKKLRERERKPYRLPTEAEWEYACRAGSATPFSFGQTIATDQANYNGNFIYGLGIKGTFRKKTTPVNTFPPNPWGLNDMHGNLWQWCQDYYGDYPQQNVVDPQGPEKGGIRVLRGGSWRDAPGYCRSAYRHWLSPEHSYIYNGIRICFTPE